MCGVRATLAMTVAAMALAGCAAQPRPSSPGLAGPTAVVATPSADERGSPVAPEEIPTLTNLCGRPGQLVPGGVARANQDTVVHVGPGAHFEPTAATIAESLTRTPLPDPYQVSAGDRVVIQDGPLRVGDVDWFLVYSAEERGVGSFGATVPISHDVWVPASDGERVLFEPLEGDTVPCLFVAAGGPGRAVLIIPSGPCASGALCAPAALAWVASAPSAGACRLVMTDSDSKDVVVDADVGEWSSGASWWHGAESRLLVETDCIWSVRTADA